MYKKFESDLKDALRPHQIEVSSHSIITPDAQKAWRLDPPARKDKGFAVLHVMLDGKITGCWWGDEQQRTTRPGGILPVSKQLFSRDDLHIDNVALVIEAILDRLDSDQDRANSA